MQSGHQPFRQRRRSQHNHKRQDPLVRHAEQRRSFCAFQRRHSRAYAAHDHRFPRVCRCSPCEQSMAYTVSLYITVSGLEDVRISSLIVGISTQHISLSVKCPTMMGDVGNSGMVGISMGYATTNASSRAWQHCELKAHRWLRVCGVLCSTAPQRFMTATR
jgi:hypothetical protein